jgi:hypothetical protein
MRARAVQGIVCLALCASVCCGRSLPAAACSEPGEQAGQTASGTGTQQETQQGAVTAVQNQALSQSMSQGGTPSGPGAGFPTGHSKYNWHDAYVSNQPTGWADYKSQSSEQSAIGSIYYKLPRSILGANIQAGVFGGENWASTVYTPATANAGRLSSTKQANLSDVEGGYVLVNFGPYYLMNTVAAFQGKMDQKGPGLATGSYGTSGFADTVVAGHVFELPEAMAPYRLDVRGGVLYSNASGGGFTNTHGEFFRPSSEEWTASLSVMLFRDFELSSGTLRPYVKAGLKEHLSYTDKVEDTYHGRTIVYRYGESPTLGDVETGLDYSVSSFTFTGAVYGEAASDQVGVGGRLGAKIAF